MAAQAGQARKVIEIEIGGVSINLGATRAAVLDRLGARYRVERGQSLSEVVVKDPSPDPVGTVIGRLQFTGDRLSYAESTRAFTDDEKPAAVAKALFSILDKSIKRRERIVLGVYPSMDEHLVSRSILFTLPERQVTLAVDEFSTGDRRFTLVRVDESIGDPRAPE
jgi:hypothetical protein